MRVDRLCHAARAASKALPLPYLGMGLPTEERLRGIPCMYGLSTLFEVPLPGPPQTIEFAANIGHQPD